MRRLLLGIGGGAGFTLPPEASFAITAASEGGWGGNHANPTYYNGKTYFAYVDGTAGDVVVASYNHSTEAVVQTVLHAALSDDMVHAEPTLLVRASDHKILVCYTGFDTGHCYLRISTSAEDVSSFAAEVDLDAQLSGGVYLYPHLMQLDNGTIYLFLRRDVGPGVPAIDGAPWGYATSTDGGATWSALTTFFVETGAFAGYIEASKTSGTRIDFTATSIPSGSTPPASLYHAYFDGTFHKTDGTALSLPFDTADMTLVWSAVADSAISSIVRVVLDAGSPVILVVGTYGGANHVRYATYSGSWSSAEILSDFTGGLALIDGTSAVIGQVVGGVTQVFRYSALDVSMITEQLTSGTDHSFRAIPVIDAASDLKYLWLEGSSTGTVGNTTCRTMGYGT